MTIVWPAIFIGKSTNVPNRQVRRLRDVEDGANLSKDVGRVAEIGGACATEGPEDPVQRGRRRAPSLHAEDVVTDHDRHRPEAGSIARVRRCVGLARARSTGARAG